jgi:hypothetical protein
VQVTAVEMQLTSNKTGTMSRELQEQLISFRDKKYINYNNQKRWSDAGQFKERAKASAVQE